MRNIVTLNEAEEKPRFWSRQFSADVTSPQLTFDVIVGVISPVLCFVFDPVVFNDSFGGVPFTPDLPRFKVLVYLFSGLLIGTLSVWLILRDRCGGALNAIISGILLSGFFFSLVIGVLILPLSLIGLVVLIGILGFTPFLVAFVYLRNSVRAFNAAKPMLERPVLNALFLLGTVLVITPSALAHWQINRLITQSMNDLLKGDARAAESAAARLRYVSWAANLDQVVRTYISEKDQTRKATLAKAYREITGKDIDRRKAPLLD